MPTAVKVLLEAQGALKGIITSSNKLINGDSRLQH